MARVRIHEDEESPPTLWRRVVGTLPWMAAVALHLVIFVLLGWIEVPDALATSLGIPVEVLAPEEEEVEEPEPEEPEPEEPAPEPEAAPAPPEQPPRRDRRPRPPPPPDEPPPPPGPPPVADFTQGPVLGMPTSTGPAVPSGPAGAPGGVPGGTGRGRGPGVPGGDGDGPPPARVVPVGDLSRRPELDSSRMEALLRRRYPREALNSGVEGEAVVRVRVRADGSVRVGRVVRESHEGFGNACRAALRAYGNWRAPLDRQGQPVDTSFPFRCGFTIGM